MGQWVGAKGRPKVAEISKTRLLCDVTSRNPPPKTKNVFFSILTTRLAESVDVLDSSLAQLPGELWDCKFCKKGGKPGTQRVKSYNKARCSEASRFSITKIWYAYIKKY